MAFEVLLFKDFKKLRNSTKRPIAGADVGDSVYVTLKESTDINAPVFIMDASQMDNWSVSQTNYVFVDKFTRWYWIEHIVWFGPFWELHCKVDVLATYRTSIFNDTMYIQRTSKTSAINTRLIDAMFPADNNVSILEESTRMPTTPDGTYIIGVIGGGSILSKVGGCVAYYAMGYGALASLITYLFTPASYSQVSLDTIFQTYFNPLQYIVSAKWVPFNIGGSGVRKIRFGWFETVDISCQIIEQYTFTFTLAANLKIHKPVPSDSANYQNCSLYTHYHIYIPFCGDYEIATELIQLYDYVGLQFEVDPVSGDIVGEIRAGNSANFQWANGDHVMFFRSNASCDIQLAQGVVDYGGVFENVVSAVQNVGTLNVSGALSDVFDGIQASQPVISKLGGNTSRALGEINPLVTLYSCYRVINTAGGKSSLGAPCGKRMKLADLEGEYVKCANAQPLVSSSLAELDELKGLLEGGVFLE